MRCFIRQHFKTSRWKFGSDENNNRNLSVVDLSTSVDCTMSAAASITETLKRRSSVRAEVYLQFQALQFTLNLSTVAHIVEMHN